MNTVTIDNVGAHEPAELEQMVPIATVAGEPRCFQAKDCANASFADAPDEVTEPDSFQAVWVEGRWRWGERDIVGVRGYSAVVDFGPGGEDASVEVYWTGDVDIGRLN